MILARERSGVDTLLQVRTKLAVLSQNLISGFRVDANDPRQGQQPQRSFKVDGREVHGFKNGCRARLIRGGNLFRRRLALRLGRRRSRSSNLACDGVDRFDGRGIRYGGDRHGGDGFNRCRRELGDVRPETTVLGHDFLAVLRVEADHAVGNDRGVDELAGLGRREFIGGEFRRNVYPTGWGIRYRLRVGDLEVGTVLTDAQRDVVADSNRVDNTRVYLAEVIDNLTQPTMLIAAEVEAVEPVQTVGLATSNAVEVVLHLSREVVFNEVTEEFFEQAHNGEGDPVGNERLPAWRDIAALGDRRDDRRKGRRSTNAKLFKLFDQARLGIASGWSGFVALGLQLQQGQGLALFKRRQLGLGGIG